MYRVDVKMKITIIASIILLVLLLTGCIYVGEQNKNNYGVYMYSSSGQWNSTNYDNIWINNTNDFKVKIRQVLLPDEQTVSIQEFDPHESKFTRYENNEEFRWYIYFLVSQEYEEMGYIDFKIPFGRS